jgi:hypothetical protein
MSIEEVAAPGPPTKQYADKQKNVDMVNSVGAWAFYGHPQQNIDRDPTSQTPAITVESSTGAWDPNAQGVFLQRGQPERCTCTWRL